MIEMLTGLSCVVLVLVAVFLVYATNYLMKKSDIKSSMQIQSSSGDSEVMLFNYNFVEGEPEESKASKIHEAFEMVQERRDINHKKWLEIKAKAIEENSKKSPEELKLRSVTEGFTEPTPA